MGFLERLFGGKDDEYYADVATMFGRARVYDVMNDDRDILRVLDIAGTWQSASYVDERWADLAFGYHRIFDQAFGAPVDIKQALMLGGGALSYPKHVVASTEAQVEVVEIDPIVISLAQEWFFLDRLSAAQRKRLSVTCSDALVYLEKSKEAGQRYDLVVNDLFAAERPTAGLMSQKGLELVRDVLTPGGIYVANVVSALTGRKARPLQLVEEALELVFLQVEVVSLGADEPRTPDNNVVFATCGDYSLADVLSRGGLSG